MRRLALATVLCAAACDAGAEQLVLSLSSKEVAIGSTYTGTQLVAFGIVERDGQSATRSGNYDLLLTVRGPRETITVRRKEALGPIWLNRSQQKYAHVPAFLTVLASRQPEAMMSAGLRRRFAVGLDAIMEGPEFQGPETPMADPFRDALLRLKARDGLYAQDPAGVTFVTDTFFRAPIALPATAPVGPYDVEASLIAGGVVVARQTERFQLAKVGIEEQVTELARDRALVMGFGTAALSLFFGWLASVIFRRD